jgi:uncharacterized protein
MLKIGEINHLQVVKGVEFGLYVDGGEHGEILLPSRYAPRNCSPGDWLDLFIYRDSDDRLIATTETPSAMVGECAYLKVAAVNKFGAFLDWGLPKQLLVPFNEQKLPMQVGRSYVVCIFLDDATQRIAASSKLRDHLSEQGFYLQPRQAVELLIASRTQLGYQAVVNDTHLGLLYDSEIYQPLRIGQKIPGFIKHIRDDRKIDLCLQLDDQQTRETLAERIIDHLKAHGGVSTLTDSSPPDDIYRTFGVSKKQYKKALGGLYKRKRIRIDKHQVTLL